MLVRMGWPGAIVSVLEVTCLMVFCAAHDLGHGLSHNRVTHTNWPYRVSLLILGVGFTRFGTRSETRDYVYQVNELHGLTHPTRPCGATTQPCVGSHELAFVILV